MALPSSVESDCESDNLDYQIGSVTYFEDITINEGEKVEDHPGYYRSYQGSIYML